MSAEREQKRRLLEEWTPEPDDPMYEDPLHEEPASASRWYRAADPHAARLTRRAPIGMRIRGIASWPFRAPRRPRATPACPPARCDQAA